MIEPDNRNVHVVPAVSWRTPAFKGVTCHVSPEAGRRLSYGGIFHTPALIQPDLPVWRTH